MAALSQELGPHFRWRKFDRYCYFTSDFLETVELYAGTVSTV
jgi:hypothetical protein